LFNTHGIEVISKQKKGSHHQFQFHFSSQKHILTKRLFIESVSSTNDEVRRGHLNEHWYVQLDQLPLLGP